MTVRERHPDGSEDANSPGSGSTASVGQEPAPWGSRRRRRHRRRLVVPKVAFREVASSNGLLAFVILGSVLALCSVHVPVLLVVSVFALLAAVLALLGPGLPSGQVPVVAIALFAVAAYTALQALPVPFALLERLSPVAADIWGRALIPFGEGPPRVAHLSLDPGASWVEALKWWTYGAVFLAAGAFGARYGARWGAVLLLGAAFVVALSTIGHGVFNATRVFGIYTPAIGGRGFRLGPIINSNALAGYLNLGLLAGVGLVASTAPPVPRWSLAIAIATVLAVSVNTGSRGGLAGMVFGLLLLVPLLRQSRKVEGKLPRNERAYMIAAITAAIGAGAVLAVIAATRNTLHLLLDDNLKKLRMILWVPPMIRDYQWFGVGRGAFESTFAAYKMGDNNSVFAHPENFLLQWATEWGLPVGCLLVATLAWLLRPKAWGAGRTAAGSGLFAGFVALVAQNIVDLGLELPGVAIAASTAAGVAWGERAARLAKGDESPRGSRLVWSVVVVAVGLAFLVPASLIGTNTLFNDKDVVRRSFPDDIGSADERANFEGLLRSAMQRHPAEAYFPRQGAVFAMVSRSENPVPWVERALERAATSGRTHYLVGILLGRHGLRAQSLLELRYAVERDEDLTGRAARLALRLTRRHDDLLRAVPDGRGGALMLQTLGSSIAGNDQEIAYRFFEEAIERNPRALGARISIARMLLARLADQRLGARCAQERRIPCEKAVLEQVRALAQADPKDDQALELAARLLIVAGRPAAAAALMASLCPALPKRARCTDAWIDAAAQTGVQDDLTSAIKFAERDGCSSPRACARTYDMVGDVVSRTSGPYAALPFFRRAAAEEATKARWMRIAGFAAFIGAHGEASRALDHAAAFGKVGPELQESIERERNRAMRQSLQIH